MDLSSSSWLNWNIQVDKHYLAHKHLNERHNRCCMSKNFHFSLKKQGKSSSLPKKVKIFYSICKLRIKCYLTFVGPLQVAQEISHVSTYRKKFLIPIPLIVISSVEFALISTVMEFAVWFVILLLKRRKLSHDPHRDRLQS